VAILTLVEELTCPTCGKVYLAEWDNYTDTWIKITNCDCDEALKKK